MVRQNRDHRSTWGHHHRICLHTDAVHIGAITPPDAVLKVQQPGVQAMDGRNTDAKSTTRYPDPFDCARSQADINYGDHSVRLWTQLDRMRAPRVL